MMKVLFSLYGKKAIEFDLDIASPMRSANAFDVPTIAGILNFVAGSD